MSKAGDVAEALLRVLAAHVTNADKWEAHYLSDKPTTAQHRELIETSTEPFLALCHREGFRYSEILEIMPVAFKTTHAERDEIMEDLCQHVWDNYETDIPF